MQSLQKTFAETNENFARHVELSGTKFVRLRLPEFSSVFADSPDLRCELLGCFVHLSKIHPVLSEKAV